MSVARTVFGSTSDANRAKARSYIQRPSSDSVLIEATRLSEIVVAYNEILCLGRQLGAPTAFARGFNPFTPQDGHHHVEWRHYRVTYFSVGLHTQALFEVR
ncbi:hypothetical protein [Nocardioides mangrovicus]|uniref:hypothetical protein n=1 Tax=Nocardioides mangrovicus TaxID=2478913 RepID=UPI001314401C|nr:hypothetical protein [Nocardioides mangrovicus]